MSGKQERELRLAESDRLPSLGLALGTGAMLPFPLLALGGWLGWDGAIGWAVLWGAAILCFLSGVRRGLSFRTPGGPRPAQLGVFGWLFGAGFLALALPWPVPAMALLVAGYASLIWLDPAAARRREAPLYFERLRPWQMAIPVAGLLALLPVAL